MNILKVTSRVLAVGSMIGLVASQAFAAECTMVSLRNFTAGTGTDSVIMRCNGTTATVAAQISGGGVRTVSALLTAGTGGAVHATTQGFTTGGVFVGGCIAVDTPPAGSAAVSPACAATAVKWKATIGYV